MTPNIVMLVIIVVLVLANLWQRHDRKALKSEVVKTKSELTHRIKIIRKLRLGHS